MQGEVKLIKSKKTLIICSIATTFVIITALVLFISSSNHLKSIRMLTNFRVSPNSTAENVVGNFDIASNNSFWNKYIKIKNLQFYSPYYKSVKAWYNSTMEFGVYNFGDKVDLDELKPTELHPLHDAIIVDGRCNFAIQVKRANPPPTNNEVLNNIDNLTIVVLDIEYFGVPHTFVFKIDD